MIVLLDIYSRKVVGWEVWEEENGMLASELVQRTVMKEKTKGTPLVLHSDNGAPMKSFTLKTRLEELGISSSYSRPRVSNDNPYSESQFRTLKYRPNYPYEGFETLYAAREWVAEFADWYNNTHYHSGINYLTPTSLHNGTANKIMKKRKAVYAAAKLLNPTRFNRGIRKWEAPLFAELNPTSEKEKVKKTM